MSPRPALLVIAVVFAILNADITTVNVALVTVGKDLHSDLEDLQWGLNSYMLAFAALIVPAGRLADVFGRRRCLLVGSLVFAIASLICGIAPTLSVLVIGRILQGAGGALMLPAGMAIVSAAYSGNQRAVALGTLVGVAGVAQSIGPLVGGFLTAEISWRFVFLINLPLIAVVMIVSLYGIQESYNETISRRFDFTGVILLAAALTSFLIALDLTEGSDKNLPFAVGLFVLSIILLGAFTIVERVTSHAIVDGQLLRLRPFLCSCVASCLLGFVFFLFLYIAAVYFQEQLGYTAFAAGIALVPFSLALAFTGVMAGHLTNRFQLTSLLIASCVSMALGLATLSFLPGSCGYIGMVFPFLLVAIGAGPGFTLLNTAGLAAVPPERSGQAAGIIYMFRFGGGAIGIAVAATLHGAFFHRELATRLSETPVPAALRTVLEQPGAIQRLTQLENGLVASQIEQIRLAFHESFATAFADTLRLNMILPVVIAVIVIVLMNDKLGTLKR